MQTYFSYNGLGSTANVTDGAGTTTATYSYDVFGGIRSQSGSDANANEWRFTGEQRDRQGNRNFYYLRARYYDPATGRFLSQDPVPTGNLYAYVGNNPVNFTDPYALWGIPNPGKIVKNTINAVESAGQEAVGIVAEVGEQAAPVVKAVAPYALDCGAWALTGFAATGTALGAAVGCAVGVG